MLFMGCGTQWRGIVAGSAFIWRGLDYSGADVVLNKLLPSGADGAAVFRDLQTMEIAALGQLNDGAA